MGEGDTFARNFFTSFFYLMLDEISTSRSSEVVEAKGQLLMSAKQRFPKPTNPCRKLQIFMEEFVMAAPSVARKKVSKVAQIGGLGGLANSGNA